MVKPVLRYPGSKYKKIDKIIELLEIKKTDSFLDMFGGSGIVGVNVKSIIGCDVVINDYDRILPITNNAAIRNMISFGGIGKVFTKSAVEYFNKRIRNGYWDKLKKYNDILSGVSLTHFDYLEFRGVRHYKIYVDPPYHGVDGLYKESFTEDQHRSLHLMLEGLSRSNKILISYNDTPFIRKLYEDWDIKTLEYKYSTGHKRHSVNELIITNLEDRCQDN